MRRIACSRGHFFQVYQASPEPLGQNMLRVSEMAHNHLGNDTEQYRQTILETTGPSRYIFDRPLFRNRPAVTPDPRASTQGFQVATCTNTPLVDVDSDLLGITRRFGLCDSAKYNPSRDGPGRTCKLRSVPTTSAPNSLDSEDCRLSNPPCTLRGTGINRFEWLCRDPQETALEPFAGPVNYRAVAKDNHKPLIESPVMDQVSPPQAASGADVPFGSVVIGQDIRQAIASYPALPQFHHWRDAGEVQRIYGKPCHCTW